MPQIFSKSASRWGWNWAWVMGRLGEKFCTPLNHHRRGWRRRQHPPPPPSACSFSPTATRSCDRHESREHSSPRDPFNRREHKQCAPSTASGIPSPGGDCNGSVFITRSGEAPLKLWVQAWTDQLSIEAGWLGWPQAVKAERARAPDCLRLTIGIGRQARASHLRSRICCGCFVTTFGRFGADSCALGEIEGIHESRIIANVYAVIAHLRAS
jgi:hypothetical protein